VVEDDPRIRLAAAPLATDVLVVEEYELLGLRVPVASRSLGSAVGVVLVLVLAHPHRGHRGDRRGRGEELLIGLADRLELALDRADQRLVSGE